jgi:hypothetical protein
MCSGDKQYKQWQSQLDTTSEKFYLMSTTERHVFSLGHADWAILQGKIHCLGQINHNFLN